jgi:hypothetical protein
MIPIYPEGIQQRSVGRQKNEIILSLRAVRHATASLR